MASRRSRCSPLLILAALPILWGEPSHGDGGQVVARAPASDSASSTPDRASTALTDSGLATLQRHIAQREYRASANATGLQAPNRVHNLRTYFEPKGIRVHDRTRPGSPELLELNLVGVGRGETPARIGPGEVTSDGARVEIERPGLIEWYENSSAGLEQGVTLIEQPEGEGPLVVELLIRGARASLGAERVNFETPTGRQLSFAKLAALDARGRALEAHFELREHSRLRLVVDDDEAVYPVVIDPLLTASADAQLESDQADTNLGISVAAAGDVNGDGYADVIVGAHLYDAGEADEGAAFVFHGSASGIVANGSPANADAQLESNRADALLGWSVAGAGDVDDDGYADVIVGALGYDTGLADLQCTGSNSPFGCCLGWQTGVCTVEGAAFLFLGSATGIANGDPSNADAAFFGDRDHAWLGHSVAGAGDVNGDDFADVIVGAPGYDVNTTGDYRKSDLSGAAFLFLGGAMGIPDGSSATADTRLTADEGRVGLYFGWSVAGAGDVDGDGYADVIVGAPFYDLSTGNPTDPPQPELNEGAAFVFHGSAAGIADGDSTTAATQFESNQHSAYMGHSVDGAGDVNGDGYADVIVGAVLYDAGEIDEGAAFVFHGSAAGIADGDPSTAATQLESDQETAKMGQSVAGAGDVNDDGYSDVIVGAYRYDAGEIEEGAAFLFLGSASGIVANGNPANADVQLESKQGWSWLGWSVAGAGDVNDDGYSDVIVGAPSYNAGQNKEGAAFVYFGEGMPGTPTPEPTFVVGLAAGVTCLAILARRRRR